jgi:hypothetical protein
MKLFDNPDIQKNNDGHLLLDTPHRADGMRLIRQAAENGQPNALSSIIWFDVIEDQIDKAIKDFETYLPLTQSWIAKEKARIDKIWLVTAAEKNSVIWQYEYQISNSKSNVALAYLAKGDESKAMELWNEAALKHSHIESRFYPMFHLFKSNPGSAIGVLRNSFSKEELQSLIHDLTEVSNQGSGWFAKWAKEGLEILRETIKNLRGPLGASAASVATFMAAKAVNKHLRDEMQESMGDSENIADWFGDLF